VLGDGVCGGWGCYAAQEHGLLPGITFGAVLLHAETLPRLWSTFIVMVTHHRDLNLTELHLISSHSIKPEKLTLLCFEPQFSSPSLGTLNLLILPQ
jgi:hypothetical protein